MFQDQLVLNYSVLGEELGLEYGLRLSQWTLRPSYSDCHQTQHCCPIFIIVKNRL